MDAGMEESKRTRQYIWDFKNCQEYMIKEQNNMIMELQFAVHELTATVRKSLCQVNEAKGITTRGGRTTSIEPNNKVPIEETTVEELPNSAHLDVEPEKGGTEPITIPDKEDGNRSAAINDTIPFPNRIKKDKEEAQLKKSLENLKQIHINIPFIEALAQMPKYAKFLKSLLTNKSKLEEACTVTMNGRCSAALLDRGPVKEKDPGSFTIPCRIGDLEIGNALADLGASISLMPYSLYEKLGLREPNPTRMCIELADRSIQYPMGIAENVMITIEKFDIPIDFVILDMPKNSITPIILGRPFLATTHALIDVFNKKITLKVGDEQIIFDIEKTMKKSQADDYSNYGTDELSEVLAC